MKAAQHKALTHALEPWGGRPRYMYDPRSSEAVSFSRFLWDGKLERALANRVDGAWPLAGPWAVDFT